MRNYICGVYLIVGPKNKFYVGSAINIVGRWTVHKHGLRNGRHHSKKLQRAWDKHGEAAFKFVVYKKCSAALLEKEEQKAMDKFFAVSCGYNCQPFARSPQGTTMSHHTRKIVSRRQIEIGADPAEKKRRSARAKAQHAAGNFGRASWKPGTAERVARSISRGRVGKKWSAAVKKKLAKAQRRRYNRLLSIQKKLGLRGTMSIFEIERRLKDGRLKTS